jgi:hypothetical protein
MRINGIHPDPGHVGEAVAAAIRDMASRQRDAPLAAHTLVQADKLDEGTAWHAYFLASDQRSLQQLAV